MAHFQENRFLGLSSRTALVTLGIIAVVVGLFFIPKMIQSKWTLPGKSSGSASGTQVVASKAPRQAANEDPRAALSSGSLQGLSDEFDSQGDKGSAGEQQAKTKGKGADGADSNGTGGLFSGWNVKVRARGDSDAGAKELPRGVSLDNLTSREASAFFKKSRGDVARFVDRNRLKQLTPITAALEPFLKLVDQVAAGLGKGSDPKTISQQLVGQHRFIVQAFAANGLDRGMLLEWLDIPLIRMIDTTRGGNIGVGLYNSFSPRITLRKINIKERADRSGSRVSSSMNAELAVKGSDVESVTIFYAGQPLREVRLGRADAQGFKVFRMNGSADGLWGIQAHDKFGSGPVTKVYSFYPRVRRFRRLDDGSYDIAFSPRSAKNSLDRYFAVALSSRQANQSSDPSVTVF